MLTGARTMHAASSRRAASAGRLPNALCGYRQLANARATRGVDGVRDRRRHRHRARLADAGRLLARVAFDQDLERSRRVAEGRDRILIPARGHHAAVLVPQLFEQCPRCRLLDPALDLIADTVRIKRLAGVDDAPEAA